MTTTNNLYDRWIEALEHGDYKKGRNVLRTEHDEYCCLGVACDLVDSDQWNNPYANHFMYRLETNKLPRIIADELGLHSQWGTFKAVDLPEDLLEEIYEEIPAIDPYTKEIDLSFINDNVGGFDLIIKVLEARPKSLFKDTY